MKYLLIFALLLFADRVAAQEDSVSYEEEIYEEPSSDSDEYEESSSELNHQPMSPKEVSSKKGYPQERVPVKRFDRDKWKKVVNGQDFSEVESKKKRKDNSNEAMDSASSKSKRRMHEEFGDDESEESDSSLPSLNIPFLDYIFYAIAIGIIGYILYLIIKNTSIKSSTKIAKPENHDPSAPVEDIKELEIDRLLREAMTAGNYRLAIRICFLGLLKKLDEDGLISWKKDKTNRDYLTELFMKARYYDEVQRLTLAYEEVWYGDHSFSTQTYEEIISSFKTIDQQLNADKTQ
jgi:hypothetical protein